MIANIFKRAAKTNGVEVRKVKKKGKDECIRKTKLLVDKVVNDRSEWGHFIHTLARQEEKQKQKDTNDREEGKREKSKFRENSDNDFFILVNTRRLPKAKQSRNKRIENRDNDPKSTGENTR